jgi:hypothetical protein
MSNACFAVTTGSLFVLFIIATWRYLYWRNKERELKRKRKGGQP